MNYQFLMCKYAWVISFNLYKTSVEVSTINTSFYRWMNWGSRRLSYLLKVTWLLVSELGTTPCRYIAPRGSFPVPSDIQLSASHTSFSGFPRMSQYQLLSNFLLPREVHLGNQTGGKGDKGLVAAPGSWSRYILLVIYILVWTRPQNPFLRTRSDEAERKTIAVQESEMGQRETVDASLTIHIYEVLLVNKGGNFF